MRVFLCFLLATLLSLFALSAQAALSGSSTLAAPLARIIYTAGTLGFVHSCQTCDGAPLGGLARRPLLLRNLMSGQHRALVLAGPGEFYADRTDPVPDESQKITPALLAAFGHMPYTAIYLSQAAVQDMRQQDLTLPANGIIAENKPVTAFFHAGAFKVACVFLPAGIDMGVPSPDQITAAQLAAKDASASSDLVIAISPWGMYAENALAPSLGGYFHILLGGGAGVAIHGQATGDSTAPGPLWLRSDQRGRAVNVLDIFSLPAPASPWLDGINFTSRLAFLESTLPEDVHIHKLISDLRE